VSRLTPVTSFRGTPECSTPSVLAENVMTRLAQPAANRPKERAPARDLPVRFELKDGGPDYEPAIVAIEKAATEAATRGGLHDDEAHFLGVAIREAIVNALRHGRPKEGAGWASVQVCVSARGALVATVRDRGPGFDPAAVPDPLADENLGRGCGRGLLFMKRFADRVLFSFPRRGGAVVRLEKDLKRR
jgi:serine/threonine-protein kinase RsbW